MTLLSDLLDKISEDYKIESSDDRQFNAKIDGILFNVYKTSSLRSYYSGPGELSGKTDIGLYVFAHYPKIQGSMKVFSYVNYDDFKKWLNSGESEYNFGALDHNKTDKLLVTIKKSAGSKVSINLPLYGQARARSWATVRVDIESEDMLSLLKDMGKL